MNPTHAGISGCLTGLLFGLAICLIQNIPLVDALFRILVLALAGAWMGVMLAWLNVLLPTHQHDGAKQQQDYRS